MKPTAPHIFDRDDLGSMLRMAFGPGYQVALDATRPLRAVRNHPPFPR